VTANAYSFLPWLRAGITTQLDSDPGTASRASVPVNLLVTGEGLDGRAISTPVNRTVQLYGPGDVIGVDTRAISRTEPRPGTTAMEPNFLAHIEFSDEDFVWRYSPAPADHGTARLAPWLALVVFATPEGSAAGEYSEAPRGTAPLPLITVSNPAGTLPPPEQLGAWAHVHVNGSLVDPVVSDGTPAALAALADVLGTNPDSACSRLLCPRRLSADTTYDAFLVPAFETGRLAGLGLDPGLAPGALYSSWGPSYPGRPAEGQLPYYHRWSFRTGDNGDFEFLVRLLQPRVPDARVGRRDVDVHRSAGLGLPGIDTPAALNGVLKLGGALKVPPAPDAPPDPFDNWDTPYPHTFQRALAGVINLADEYQRKSPTEAHAGLALATEVDPIVTPPRYGRWPALTSRLLTDEDGNDIPAPANRNWVHRLNLDPRFRVAANLGTQVVQARQEELMAAAWAQVGDVLAANNRIKAAQLAREVGHALQIKNLDPSASVTSLAATGPGSGRSLRLTAPAHARLTVSLSAGGATSLVAGGDDPSARVGLGYRVATSQVAAAPLSPAMRRITRPGSRLMRSLSFPEGPSGDALLPLMDAEVGAVTAAAPKRVPPAVVTAEQLAALLHPGAGGDPVDSLPHSPDFVLRALDDLTTPTPGRSDSAEATQFKAALHELYQSLGTATAVSPPAARPRLGVDTATTSVLTGLQADQTVPKLVLDQVGLPERLRPFAEQFLEAMAYPVIDVPMYRALLDLSVDTFVPNLDLVPPNSITLLANNREFIESYLVGLNHEMARELLWREYPTDQRGTPFRQFWDARVTLSPPDETEAQRRERGYDIPPIHKWPRTGALGQNDNRQALVTPQKDDLVLVIRGELLNKYPTAAIYAQRAQFHPGGGQRDLVDIPDGQQPTTEQIRLPLYEAKVDPDVYLLGFDLDADEARGTATDAGWFFVLKERPGDPRFGVDDGPAERVEVWNDLTWSQVDPHQHGFLELDADTSVPLASLDGSPDDQAKQDQRGEDENLPLWYAGLSSADIAYILFQVPVLVAVHAQEMLPR
jgi:hypothetical protein